MISWYIDSSCITGPSTPDHAGVFRARRGLALAVVCPACAGPSGGSEELLRGPDAVGERVDLVEGVVQVETGPGRCLEPERAVQRPGAVMPGPDGDAEFVEYLPDVMRMNL